MRISLAEARRLGIKGIAEKKKPSAGRRGKNRAPRGDHGTASFRVDIDLAQDPQPKERPRTVVNAESLVAAFVQAKGNVAAFREMLKGRMSHTYTPKNTADYENTIKAHATAEMARRGLRPFECPVRTHVHMVFEGDPATWPTSPGDGDADNLEKAVLDALNGIVYEDDRLVVQSSRSKSCGPRPKVIIRVRPANSSVGDRHQPGADGAGAGKSRSRQSA